ncbi:hypothetical protein CR513_34276, partial [Mucuna pruriens]
MLVTRNQATSSSNGEEEDTLQWLLQTVASLQARNDEQTRLNAGVEQRQMEAKERHKKAGVRHMEDLKAASKRDAKLRRQLAVIEKLGGAATPLSTLSTQAFWAQPFNEEIDKTTIPSNFREVVIESFNGTQDPHTHLQAFQSQMYISKGNNLLNCKLFPGTLRGVAMNWLTTLPPRSIRSFSDIATSFASQFTINKVKHLEVPDLFDIRQNKGETLKSYLARFNNATIRHIEVEEDHADRLEAERQSGARDMRLAPQGSPRGEVKYPPKPRDYPLTLTPLREKRAQILRDIYHTYLLKYPKEMKG